MVAAAVAVVAEVRAMGDLVVAAIIEAGAEIDTTAIVVVVDLDRDLGTSSGMMGMPVVPQAAAALLRRMTTCLLWCCRVSERHPQPWGKTTAIGQRLIRALCQ